MGCIKKQSVSLQTSRPKYGQPEYSYVLDFVLRHSAFFQQNAVSGNVWGRRKKKRADDGEQFHYARQILGMLPWDFTSAPRIFFDIFFS